MALISYVMHRDISANVSLASGRCRTLTNAQAESCAGPGPQRTLHRRSDEVTTTAKILRCIVAAAECDPAEK